MSAFFLLLVCFRPYEVRFKSVGSELVLPIQLVFLYICIRPILFASVWCPYDCRFKKSVSAFFLPFRECVWGARIDSALASALWLLGREDTGPHLVQQTINLLRRQPFFLFLLAAMGCLFDLGIMEVPPTPTSDSPNNSLS